MGRRGMRARSAERPAIGPTCTRRLNLAAVLARRRLLFGARAFGANDGAAAAALVPPGERSEVRGQRQTGGIERSTVSGLTLQTIKDLEMRPNSVRKL
jgi:hypothetical protein